jgi:hypothetical protein
MKTLKNKVAIAKLKIKIQAIGKPSSETVYPVPVTSYITNIPVIMFNIVIINLIRFIKIVATVIEL